MKKFEFRLQSAFRWRDMQLQLERAKLQKLLGEEQRLKNDLQSLAEQRHAAVSEIQSAKQLQRVDLRAVSTYLIGADARSHMLRQQIAKAAGPIQQQRQSVLKAERNVRLLEKLRESRYLEWKREFDEEIELTAEESWLSANFRESNPQT
jgi:hypothetical protein